ncbi:MAG: hypothetical protein PHV30_09000 [Candidatus Margulisbacteria bacterium]|nr:hypothetical protein [Candidatus Margulisiibacteriota bacterium]
MFKKIISANNPDQLLRNNLEKLSAKYIELARIQTYPCDQNNFVYIGKNECQLTSAIVSLFLELTNNTGLNIYYEDHVFVQVLQTDGVYYFDMTYKQYLIDSLLLSKYYVLTNQSTDDYYDNYGPPYPSDKQIVILKNYVNSINTLPSFLFMKKNAFFEYLNVQRIAYNDFLKKLSPDYFKNLLKPFTKKSLISRFLNSDKNVKSLQTDIVNLRSFIKFYQNKPLKPDDYQTLTNYGSVALLKLLPVIFLEITGINCEF